MVVSRFQTKLFIFMDLKEKVTISGYNSRDFIQLFGEAARPMSGQRGI